MLKDEIKKINQLKKQPDLICQAYDLGHKTEITS
jgi:hypothetical protein